MVFRSLGDIIYLFSTAKLFACLEVGHFVSAAADLGACAAVGAGVHLVQAQIAFARHCHAECSVAEHLEANKLASRACYVFGADGVGYRAHLLDVEFAGEHHYVGVCGVKAHGLDVDMLHWVDMCTSIPWRRHAAITAISDAIMADMPASAAARTTSSTFAMSASYTIVFTVRYDLRP